MRPLRVFCRRQNKTSRRVVPNRKMEIRMKIERSPLQEIKRRQRIEKAKSALKKIAGAIITGIAIVTIATVLIVMAKVIVHYTVFIWNLVP